MSKWIICSCPELASQLHTFEIQEPELSFLLPGRLHSTLTAVAHWQCTAAAILRASLEIGSPPDLVFFAWLDSYLSGYLTHHIVERIFPYCWSGLYFHPHHTRVKPAFSAVRRGPLNPHAALYSSRCLAVAVLDEGVTEQLQSKIKRKPIVVFPDIADESSPDPSFTIARQIQQVAGGRKIIGLLGLLSKRKGLLTLLDIAHRTSSEDWLFVFAGELVESTFTTQELERIQAGVKSAPYNCYFHFEHIPGEPQFNALVNTCDILFAAYIDFFHSSNILTKAAVFKKLVLVSNGFCMGERVNKFNLGLSIPQNDIFSCIEALHFLCRSPEMSNHQLRPNYEGYHALHSNEQLQKSFEAILTMVYLTRPS